MDDTPVWLITGATSGLGLCLVRAVLAAGFKVVASSRSLTSSSDLCDQVGDTGNVKWIQLDVSADDVEKQVEECVNAYGRIDVLVNNAGYAAGGALEDMPISAARALVETNFFGAVRTIKSLIPHMREHRSGIIVNVTSAEGISAAPGISMYGASKFALEGVSEALSVELQPFGIRVLIVEPGGMRTSFLHPSRIAHGLTPLSEPYRGTISEHVLNAVISAHGQQMLDPDRAAQRIVEAVSGGGDGWSQERKKYLRLPLGKEVAGRMAGKIETLQENLEATKGIWTTVDFDA